MRQIFSGCRIEGTVDFIFGCGEAVFQNCEIRSVKEERTVGYVAAPAHSPVQKKGFHFQNCRFTCEDGVAPGSIYLARPWRDYGLAEFENCLYGRHIATEGFDKWNDTFRDQTARFYETPAVPGRVAWINRRRDGSYAYYISEPVMENDAKGLAPFLMTYTQLLQSEEEIVL